MNYNVNMMITIFYKSIYWHSFPTYLFFFFLPALYLFSPLLFIFTLHLYPSPQCLTLFVPNSLLLLSLPLFSPLSGWDLHKPFLVFIWPTASHHLARQETRWNPVSVPEGKVRDKSDYMQIVRFSSFLSLSPYSPLF